MSMHKNTLKRSPAPKKNAKSRAPAEANNNATARNDKPAAEPVGSLDALKENIKRIDRGNLFDALKKVKNMKPEEWRNPQTVKQLTETIAQDIGVKVDPKRIDAFMNAYTDITKNSGEKGPDLSVEEIAKKYAADRVDDKTLKEIKKFIK
jgi:hypothetical protein